MSRARPAGHARRGAGAAWLVIVLVAVLAAGATVAMAPAHAQPAAAPAPALPEPATGFDHLAHLTRVEVSGQTNPPCAACHPLTPTGGLAGRPGHAACFPCHGPAPRPGAAPPSPPPAICAACHPPAGLATRRPPLAVPAYGPDREHGLQLDHAVHGPACATCHTTGAAMPPPPPRVHARCAACHLTRAPLMSSCAACHPVELGPHTRPALARSLLSVAATYDHARHARRAGAAPAATCVACHQAITETHDRALPAPTAAACSTAGCHDGEAAFAITVGCTRCHTAPTSAPPLPSPSPRFRHRQHEALIALTPCARCHGLDGRGQPTVPGHAACSDAACHQRDFGSATPTTCGACHQSREPWRRLLPDQRPPADTELGVALAHRRHPGPCASCHQRTTPGRPLRPPRGHAACTGAGCHAAERGPAPALTDCTGCHQPGVVDARARRRSLALWSVAAAFDHARHRVDPQGGQALPCTACHDPTVAVADDQPMPPPAKARCAPCHDGAIAFKMTGHGCARCHRGAGEAAAP